MRGARERGDRGKRAAWIRSKESRRGFLCTCNGRLYKRLLVEGGEKGEFELDFGEYEALFPNKVCLSVAVTGEREYYVRCLVVKYGEGKCYFWPVGLGLNGSLEECEAEKYHMNKVCIERIQQLDRHNSKITIEK